MATYSSVLPWEISWTEETGGLQSIESDTSDSAHNTTLFIFYFIFFFSGLQVSFFSFFFFFFVVNFVIH